jgi:plasmid stabilization system protein ParE
MVEQLRRDDIQIIAQHHSNRGKSARDRFAPKIRTRVLEHLGNRIGRRVPPYVLVVRIFGYEGTGLPAKAGLLQRV